MGASREGVGFNSPPADVVGYSRLMGADEEGTDEPFKAHLGELIDPKIRA